MEQLFLSCLEKNNTSINKLEVEHSQMAKQDMYKELEQFIDFETE